MRCWAASLPEFRILFSVLTALVAGVYSPWRNVMEIRELRYFVALAEELHFARAAARVGIEQSPLSKSISELERHLGVQLFARTRRSTTLTRAGETLLEDARRILASVDQARHNLAEAACGRRGRLCLALCEGLAHPRISKLLKQTRADDPDVHIELVHYSFDEQVRGLLSGSIDIALALAAGDHPNLLSIPLWKDPQAVVMRADSPLAKCSCLTQWPCLSPLILLGSSPWIARDICQTSMQRSAYSRVQYVPTVDFLLTLVEAGYGTGVMSAAQAETIHRDDIVVRPICGSEGTITSYLIIRSENRALLATRFVERALQLAQSACAERRAETGAATTLSSGSRDRTPT
jgi:DNA-binding transcriptional LysR family regulator